MPGKKSPGKPSKAAAAGSSNGRLGPGELDGHVLAFMRDHRDDAPHTPSAIAKAISRSAGAVANCLARLEGRDEVRQVKRKPRAYSLTDAGAR